MTKDKSISVNQISDAQSLGFSVAVSTDGTTTEHAVTVSKQHYQTLTRGRYSPAQLIEASILFLLDREPKEAILQRFDITLIGCYFPEFEDELPRYFAGVVKAGADAP